MRRFAMFTILAAAAACGGASTIDGYEDEGINIGGSTSSTSSQGGSGGAGASGSGGAGGYVRCPDTLPADNTACSIDELFCTYGSDLRPLCRDQARCSGGLWFTFEANCPPQACGTKPTHGTVCSQEGQMCAYSGGPICVCSSCTGGPCMPPPPVWTCSAPGMGCPDVMPNSGTACSQAGLECRYGDPSFSGAALKCEAGEWTAFSEPCPL